MASSELARPEVPNFVDLLRSFPGQARLALGTRGVLWATFAGVVGVVCCVVAFAAIGLSLHRSDVDPERRKARDVLTLDNASRLLMRSILASSSAGQTTGATPISGAPWRNFTESLGTLCRDFNVAPQTAPSRPTATPATRPGGMPSAGPYVENVPSGESRRRPSPGGGS